MDVDGRDDHRRSLLHDCQFPEEAAALIELGADVNATDDGGNTPLFHYVAVPHRGLELIRLLLRHGCDAAAVNRDGEDVAAYARECYDSVKVEDPDDVGEYELSILAAANFLEDVKAAGGWKAYLRAPRVQLVRLRSLCDRGRAAPPSVGSGKLQRLRNLSAAEVAVFARLFGAPTPRASSGRLPNEIFWHVLAFWRTDRD
jgi:ankyrin repeat protein